MKHCKPLALLLITCFAFTRLVTATPLNISDAPLFVTEAVAPLTMLVMGRDHKLFYEAYNDVSDLDGDGTLETTYTPSIDYYGYFDSYKCYGYSSGLFVPSSTTTTKKCSGAWSGDYLNYLTTSRMDALRKVLYGGYRSTDTSGQTILERANIPQDAHSWGKQYTSVAVDGYSISDYTPLSLPTTGNNHLFANTTVLGGSGAPFLRVLQNDSHSIWEWVSIERPVAGTRVENGGSGPVVTPTDYIVRVEVCKSTLLESNCKLYPSGDYRPTGLLQDFGENEGMKFGLLTGSYNKNLSGGVLRKNISLITDEINIDTGSFTTVNGIINTINTFRDPDFGGSYEHGCGFIFNRATTEGECSWWGNPIGEMIYETMRYYAGKDSPTSDFTYTGGIDETLGLPLPSWQNPYDSNSNPYCAKANMLVISDINPSYDTDQLPGSYFNAFTGDMDVNVSSLTHNIWLNEDTDADPDYHFIGQSEANYDGAPSTKLVTSFSSIRGLSPDEPTKQGGYYSAGLAHYAHVTDLNPAEGEQNINTFTVALASPLPEIEIPVSGSTVTLVPFAKSVGGTGAWCNDASRIIDRTQGAFQPTNTIVDFYVTNNQTNTQTFRINFEDVEAGADHDMDAIVEYTWTLNPDNTITVDLTSSYAAGCIIQHIGYIISGTTQDGTYLEVRDLDTAIGDDLDYFLDTPAGFWASDDGGIDGQPLPTTASRTFTANATPAATLLKSPLWYTAKWGGFTDRNSNLSPDQTNEWDADSDGAPDNYFLVTNALLLQQQLHTAFSAILNQSSSATASSVNGGTISTNSRIYQPIFNTNQWDGQLLAFPINSDGTINRTGTATDGAIWDTATILKTQDYDTGRAILTLKKSTGAGIPFRWPSDPAAPSSSELDVTQTTYLNTNPTSSAIDTEGANRLNYLRGSTSLEVASNGTFRNRASPLGDLVNSTPIYVGSPDYKYQDDWPSGSAENAASYSTFRSSYASRTPIVYIGANDGMLHAFNATSGAEVFAYVPDGVYSRLSRLTNTDYSHTYYVDGTPSVNDVFYTSAWHTVLVGGLNNGGQSIYALDITDPATVTEDAASSKVLWEFSDADDADMGYTFSKPSIGRLADGSWAAVFGNGYNNTVSDQYISTTGNAVLYIVNIQTGALIRKIDTGYGITEDAYSTGHPNGLSTPVLVDVDNNHVADYVYAGDLQGNLWKFDLTSATSASWTVAFSGAPLFTAGAVSGASRPITSKPSVGRLDGGTNNEIQIYFGTGKYLEPIDKDVTQATRQAFYGITDNHESPVYNETELLAQRIVAETLVTTNGSTAEVRISTALTRSSSHRGWKMDLELNGVAYSSVTATGERQISDSVLRNGRIIFSTLIPSEDVCSAGGDGWLMELNAYDGARLEDSPFDLNGDNSFTSSDKVDYNDGESTAAVAISGRRSQVGIIPTPSILTDAANGVEYKYTPGTTSEIEMTVENPGSVPLGRQSWRQKR